MPLRQTDYGYTCPLGRWRQYNFEGRDPFFDMGPTPADIGDPQSECIRCSFSRITPETLDIEGQDWDWNKVCQAPSDMGLEEFEQLRERYNQTSESQRHQKPIFWEWVSKNRIASEKSVLED